MPQDVCGYIDILGEPTDVIWRKLIKYCEGSRIECVTEQQGWYARLSAHLDCTDWRGPYKTEREALGELCDEYEICENGEPYGYLEDEQANAGDHARMCAKDEGDGR